jgi:uncharacterized membrane protein YraQ (UPF0718 family)
MSSQEATTNAPPDDAAAGRRSGSIGALLLVAALSALFFYKWGGSLRALRGTLDTGKLAVSPSGLLEGGALAAMANYFGRIWPALVYGIVIGAIVRAAVSPKWVAKILGSGGAKPSLAGAACGSPLMLCSCCVTPIFTSVYQRGARLGPSLSLMLASPGLNVAALALTFILMPLKFALLRLVAAALIVFVAAPAIGKRHEAIAPPPVIAAADEPPTTLAGMARRFARSLAYMTFVTVPLIAAGVLVSAWLLPHAVHMPAYGAVLTILVVALAATLVALPTFFEVPLAFLLLQLGAPPGAAVAMLIAGPIVNLPSLFVLTRETSARVAISVAASVWLAASVAGLATSIG